MKIEIDIDPYELVESMKSSASIALILKELEPDEADILDYMPIEQLVQFALDNDPEIGIIKDKLRNIIGSSPVPEGLIQLSTTIKQAFERYESHKVMKTIKSALRNEVTILYEVK